MPTAVRQITRHNAPAPGALRKTDDLAKSGEVVIIHLRVRRFFHLNPHYMLESPTYFQAADLPWPNTW